MSDPTVQAIRDRLEKYGQSDYALDAIPLMTDLRYVLDLLAQQAAEGQALREERDAAQGGGIDYVDLLRRAKAIVRASPLWKRFIEHTPLENDIAVWMADFAGFELGAAEAALAQLHAAQARLIAQWREEARLARPLESAPLSRDKRERIATWMMYTNRANELAVLATPAPTETPKTDDDEGLRGSTVPEDAPR